MMHEYMLTVGLFDKDTKKQMVETNAAKEALDNILIKKYGMFAYTMMDCQGVYTMDSDGSLVHEPSIRIELVVDECINDTIRAIVNDIKTELNQESVMVKHTEADIDFI